MPDPKSLSVLYTKLQQNLMSFIDIRRQLAAIRMFIGLTTHTYVDGGPCMARHAPSDLQSSRINIQYIVLRDEKITNHSRTPDDT